MKISVPLIFIAFLAGVKADRQKCHSHKEKLVCKCSENEDIDVLWEDYTATDRITTLTVSSCGSANLSIWIAPDLQQNLTSVIVTNITNTLRFSPGLHALHLKEIKLHNIGNLPYLDGAETFDTFNRLDHFHLENIVIGKFSQSFIEVEVKGVFLKNVLISDMKDLDLNTTQGEFLEIIDSYLNVTDENLTLEKFKKIKIENTVIAFPHKKGNVFIDGTNIIFLNNTLVNASVSITGKNSLNVTNTCGDGSNSEMRLNSDNKIMSRGNELPSNIMYDPPGDYTDKLCLHGKCNCSPNGSLPVYGLCKVTDCKQNHAKTIHQETSHRFFMYFTIIASAIVASI